MADLTTLGALRAALSEAPPDLPIFIDNRPPSALSSYRGYYDHLAIERNGSGSDATEVDKGGDPFELNMAGYGTYTPGASEVRIKREPKVADFIKALDLADGVAFEGYKGGQFHMESGSDIWVSEYGQCDRLRVTSVEVLPDRVDLLTREVEW